MVRKMNFFKSVRVNGLINDIVFLRFFRKKELLFKFIFDNKKKMNIALDLALV